MLAIERGNVVRQHTGTWLMCQRRAVDSSN
jgi:hypothetical protein